MEKFLKVCWKIDRLSGESNCNIDNDFEENTLFYNESSSHKKEKIEKEIETEILNGNITDNVTGFKITIQKGCEPSLFTQIVRRLEEGSKVVRSGDVNNSSANVHRVKKYTIKVCINEKK